jgi:hypothetical protein
MRATLPCQFVSQTTAHASRGGSLFECAQRFLESFHTTDLGWHPRHAGQAVHPIPPVAEGQRTIHRRNPRQQVFKVFDIFFELEVIHYWSPEIPSKRFKKLTFRLMAVCFSVFCKCDRFRWQDLTVRLSFMERWISAGGSLVFQRLITPCSRPARPDNTTSLALSKLFLLITAIVPRPSGSIYVRYRMCFKQRLRSRKYLAMLMSFDDR